MLGTMAGIKVHGNNRAHKEVARVRATALESLLANNFSEGPRIFTIASKHVGDGALGGDRVPVLTAASKSTMFPGFGRLQAESLFVCGPKDADTQSDPVDLSRIVMSNACSEVAAQSEITVRNGEVVVVHRDSIWRDSTWLNEERAPKLWLPRADLPIAHLLDPNASVRVFYAIQAVIPRYAAVATFFLRVFPVGRGVAFQVAAVTLGPPITSKADLLYLLFKYRQESKEKTAATTGKFATPAMSILPSETHAMAKLQRADRVRLMSRAFQNEFDLQELASLDPQSELERGGEYSILFQRVVDESATWPGIFEPPRHLREAHSYDLPKDFFGRPEVIALVHLTYERVIQAALKAIDEGGFDISRYRDDQGRFLIQAGNIDQLIVGERVSMHDNQQAPPTAAAPTTAQPQQQTARAAA
jgi:hypothetical protein